jgi:RNA polymerase sigma-70 factor, ECF subfamily
MERDPEETMKEEATLRAAVLAGDEAAWRVLYERHFDGLFAYLFARAGRDTHRTEELVQECWLVAVRRIRRFDPGKGGFGTWLRGTADHALVNQRRTWARRLRLWQTHAPPAEPQVAPPHHEAGERVMLAMSVLPGPYQAVLRAKYEEQRPVADIAAEWGQTTKSVESLLTRARHAFREACMRLDATEPGEP